MRVNKNSNRIQPLHGTIIYSTYTCNLGILWLTHHMIEAHIMLGLAHSSLISTRMFCNAGCKVTFDKGERRVNYKGKLVLTRDRDDTPHMWQLPVIQTKQHREMESLDLQVAPTHKCNHATNLVDHTVNTMLYTLPYT